MAPGDAPLGYEDTPYLPGMPWRVHDPDRPQPTVVEPGAEPGTSPSDALVLFEGTDLSGWLGRDGPAAWNVRDGYLEVVPGTGDIWTEAGFGDCQLHVEWATPADVAGSSQGRGNSGVFLMGRYEIQVLDSHDNPTYADGSAAAIYGQRPPLVNASRPPGEWQSYDIAFSAPRWNGAQLEQPAALTLIHNGVLVHHARPLIGATAHRRVGEYEPHPSEAALMLQDHGDAVRYRNIWIRPLDG